MQAEDWFVKNNYPANTKAIFEELERYDKLLAERKAQGLSTTLSGATTKNLNNKRRIEEQVLFLTGRNRETNESMTKEEALSAAFGEIDAVALPVHNPKDRYNFFPCVEYCKRQKHAREGRGREKVTKGKGKKQDDEEEQEQEQEEEEEE